MNALSDGMRRLAVPRGMGPGEAGYDSRYFPPEASPDDIARHKDVKKLLKRFAKFGATAAVGFSIFVSCNDQPAHAETGFITDTTVCSDEPVEGDAANAIDRATAELATETLMPRSVYMRTEALALGQAAAIPTLNLAGTVSVCVDMPDWKNPRIIPK